MARKMKTMDGNTAAAWASYAFTEVAAIYPITPSSVMAEMTDEWAVQNKTNIFGQPVKLVEMQHEGGAAGAVHGSLSAGALTTTYTASQGLLLMIPNMYKIAGEQLPCVIHVSARTISTHALNIFGDHSDVMSCRQTGFAMLCSSSPQEVMDLAAIAHLSAIKGSMPFLHFFDGFRTSHEIDKIEVWDYEDLKDMVDMDSVRAFRRKSLNPEHPALRGAAQNPDIFFQNREACNTHYNKIPAIVEEYMEKVNERAYTDYHLVNYYGSPDADKAIVAMGSVCETAKQTIDYLTEKGEKVGLIQIHLYRPFPVKAFLAAIPKTVRKISVLDRTKEPGSIGEPLYLDVCACYADRLGTNRVPMIFGGRYGLGSKDTSPSYIIAVYRNMDLKNPKKHFTLGIEDDVTNLSLSLSLSRKDHPDTAVKGTTSCKFWGLGSDGTVGANKNTIKIIGDHTPLYVQAYFDYDSKKSGGITVSHLRFGEQPIRATYLIHRANFVACHNPAYVDKYDMHTDLRDSGTFLLNCPWDKDELEVKLPAPMKRCFAKHDIQLYTIDAIGLAAKIGLGNKTSILLQSAFFKISGIIPFDDAVKYMKDAVLKSFGAKGEKIVNMNYEAIDAGAKYIQKIEIPAEWATAYDELEEELDVPEFVERVMMPCNSQNGNDVPVSTFVELGIEDGHMPMGTSAYEKRGIAVNVPEWDPAKCVQCNQCAAICPHAAIRPIVMTEKEANAAPSALKSVPMKGKGFEHYQYAMAVSVLDCSGCQNCANVCPVPGSALHMQPIDTQRKKQRAFNYGIKLPVKNDLFKGPLTVKNTQFKQPLLEFSGACAGCGETPYAKLVTQLCGDRAYIANATGCSSIWGGSTPSNPYTVNQEGHGPAWANSLFEDNAELGMGMEIAAKQIRERLSKEIATIENPAVQKAYAEWIKTYDNSARNAEPARKLIEALKASTNKKSRDILQYKEYLAKKVVWIFGGDGWAYDIGFSGLDHVVASGEDVNILVFDTEVYSNTGGQASKATPTAAVAQFAAGGKPIKKKNLAEIAMSYGYVYVAQVSMGYDLNQTVKALKEAEEYHGPSLVIAYSPCINHGIRGGMTDTQRVMKNAVNSGYWNTFRYNPALIGTGKNPFQMDSKKPSQSYQDFIMNEVRYSSLARKFPEKAQAMYARSEQEAKERYERWTKYSRLFEE